LLGSDHVVHICVYHSLHFTELQYLSGRRISVYLWARDGVECDADVVNVRIFNLLLKDIPPLLMALWFGTYRLLNMYGISRMLR
ncbi:hypothetical protein BDFB_011283, partial [Asbolus verrucosus]